MHNAQGGVRREQRVQSDRPTSLADARSRGCNAMQAGRDRHDHARAYRVQTAAERALRHLPAAHAPISAVSPSPEDPSISLVRTVDAEISRSTLQRVPAHS